MEPENQSAEQPKECDEWARCIYERAEETAYHTDFVIYEVAAIVWSANTLLLGFILEVPLVPAKQAPVVAAAIIGLFLTIYVPFASWFMKIGQKHAYSLCREIEKRRVPPWLHLHNPIHAIYPKAVGRISMAVISLLFVGVWMYVLQRAWICVRCIGQ